MGSSLLSSAAPSGAGASYSRVGVSDHDLDMDAPEEFSCACGPPEHYNSHKGPGQHADGDEGHAGVVRWAKIGAVLCLIGFMFWALHWLFAHPDILAAALDYATAHPWRTIPVYWAANVVCVVLLLPGGPFQIASGAIWGVWLGFLTSGSAALAANTLAFVIGRYAFRDSVSKFIAQKVPTFPAIERAVAREGIRLVLLLRISPVLPDSLMNYALSLMNIEFATYVLATAIGLAPYTLLYVYTGSVSSDVIKTITGGGGEEGGGSGEEGGESSKALRIAGVVASVALFVGMVWYIGAVIKKAINEEEDGGLSDRIDRGVGRVGAAGSTSRGSTAKRYFDDEEDEEARRGERKPLL